MAATLLSGWMLKCIANFIDAKKDYNFCILSIAKLNMPIILSIAPPITFQSSHLIWVFYMFTCIVSVSHMIICELCEIRCKSIIEHWKATTQIMKASNKNEEWIWGIPTQVRKRKSEPLLTNSKSVLILIRPIEYMLVLWISCISLWILNCIFKMYYKTIRNELKHISVK